MVYRTLYLVEQTALQCLFLRLAPYHIGLVSAGRACRRRNALSSETLVFGHHAWRHASTCQNLTRLAGCWHASRVFMEDVRSVWFKVEHSLLDKSRGCSAQYERSCQQQGSKPSCSWRYMLLQSMQDLNRAVRSSAVCRKRAQCPGTGLSRTTGIILCCTARCREGSAVASFLRTPTCDALRELLGKRCKVFAWRGPKPSSR